MPCVSLIIPVYNASSYIEACLASLLAQTMDDIELLLVDDHGSDNSMQLAQAYVEAHPTRKHVRFLSTPCNMGPGAARNVGIGAAQGEYIGFVDSDDVVDPNFCELLYTAARKHTADLAYCQAQLVKPGEVIAMNNPVIESGAFDDRKRRHFLTHYTTLFVSFLYRRALLDEYGIVFPDTRSAEDSYFLTCALLAAQRMACVDQPLYQYLVHEESLSEMRNPRRYLDKLQSFDLLMEFARDKGFYESDRAELDYIYLKKGYLLSLLTYIYNDDDPQQLTVRKLYGRLLHHVLHYWENPYYRADLKLRLLHAFIRHCTRISFKVLPWYIRKTKMKL